MISMDWMNIGIDALSLIVSFIIVSLLASFFLWLIDKALPEVDFLTIRNEPMAKSIAFLGWLILYALVFAGAIIAPILIGYCDYPSGSLDICDASDRISSDNNRCEICQPLHALLRKRGTAEFAK